MLMVTYRRQQDGDIGRRHSPPDYATN